MSNKYRFSDSDDDDSDSDDEDFINKFKKQSFPLLSNQNINSQQNDESKTDSQNGLMLKSKVQEQGNQNQGGVMRENSNNSILNSQSSQSHMIPAKKIKKNIRQILSDDSDEDEQKTNISSNKYRSRNEDIITQHSSTFSRVQQPKLLQMLNMSNGNSQIIKTQDVKIVREAAFPGLYIPSSHLDLVISQKKQKEVDSFFSDYMNGGTKNVLFLQGSSGVGKKTLISYLVEKKYKWQIVHLNRMKKLQQSAEKEQQNDEDSKILTNNSYLENPVELLIYALNRSLSASLYQNEVIVLQEIPESATSLEIRRITEFINKRYIRTNHRKNPIVFILNNSIYSQFQVSKIFRDQCQEFYNNYTVDINLPNPSDIQIKQFVQKQMDNNARFQALSRFQRQGIVDDIVNTANGDISNSLNQLRLITFSKVPSSATMKNQVNKKNGNYQMKGQNEKQKDNEFSIFHTFGKFLYNKRKFKGSKADPKQMSKEELLSGKTEFYFNPMDMIRQINCSQQFVRNALQFNYLDFYGDIEDIVKQANIFAISDIFDRDNFNEKNEVMKEENEFLSSFIVAEGVMINNLNGKDVKKSFHNITKSILGDFFIDKKLRQINLRKEYPQFTLRQYVLEYNHHLVINPHYLATDLVKYKGSWKQPKQIDENANNINSIGYDTLNEDNEQDMSLSTLQAQQKRITYFRKEIHHKEIIEDDIEEC